MRDGWRIATLDNLLQPVRRAVDVSELKEVRFAGVRWYAEGAYERSVEDASLVKTKRVYEVAAGDIIYNRMWATKASFALAGDEVDGCHVTNDFPTFVATTPTTSQYLRLVLGWEPFQRQASTLASGTTERRRLHEADFLKISVPLPPLAEQRRIVDLIAAVDDAIETERSMGESARSLVESFLSTEMSRLAQGATVSFGEAIGFASGAAFPKAQQAGRAGEIPFIRVSDMNLPGNEIEILDANHWVTADTLKSLRARAHPAGTVVFPKVGAALLTEKRRMLTQPTAFDNNVMGVFPKPGHEPGFIFAFLRTVELGAFAQPGAVPSINQSHVRSLTVPNPTLKEQRELVAQMNAMDDVVERSGLAATSLVSLRSEMLTVLLSGEHEIPESYDALLEEVAA